MKFLGVSYPAAGGRLHPQHLAQIIGRCCPSLRVDWDWSHKIPEVSAEPITHNRLDVIVATGVAMAWGYLRVR